MRKGFTLIELLVVIAIIGILAAIFCNAVYKKEPTITRSNSGQIVETTSENMHTWVQKHPNAKIIHFSESHKGQYGRYTLTIIYEEPAESLYSK